MVQKAEQCSCLWLGSDRVPEERSGFREKRGRAGPREDSRSSLLSLSVACFPNTHAQWTWTYNPGKPNSSFTPLGSKGDRFWFWFLRRLSQRSVLGWGASEARLSSSWVPLLFRWALPPPSLQVSFGGSPYAPSPFCTSSQSRIRSTQTHRGIKDWENSQWHRQGQLYLQSEAHVCIWLKKWSTCLAITDSPIQEGVEMTCQELVPLFPRERRDRVKGKGRGREGEQRRKGRRDICKDGWKEEKRNGMHCLSVYVRE